MLGLNRNRPVTRKTKRNVLATALGTFLGLQTAFVAPHLSAQQSFPNGDTNRGTVATADFFEQRAKSGQFRASALEKPKGTVARFEKNRTMKSLPRIGASRSQNVGTQAGAPRSFTFDESQITNASAETLKVKAWFVPPNRIADLTNYLKSVYGKTPNVAIAADFHESKILIMAGAQGHAMTGQFLASQGLKPAEPFSVNPNIAPTMQSREYSLQNLNWRDLESLVVQIWGGKTTIRTSQDGRASLIAWPLSETQAGNVRVDRVANAVFFDGPEANVASWNQAIRMLDSRNESGGRTLRTVPVKEKHHEIVKQALSMMHLLTLQAVEKQLVNKAVWETPGAKPWGGRVATTMFGPAQNVQQTALQENQPNAQQNNAEPNAINQEMVDQGKALSSDVRVEILPDGTVIVVGPPEDAQEVTEMIRKLQDAAKQNAPEVEIYPLKNMEGSKIQPIVQEIYDQSYQPRLGEASATNLGKPNAIMIVGSKESVDAMRQLLEKLDTKSEPADAFKIFRIKNMSAIDAANRLSTYFNVPIQTAQQNNQQVATDGVNAAPQLRIIPDYRSNTVIVQGGPRELEESQQVIDAFDVVSVGEEGANQEIKVFQLKNSIAAELAPILQDALNGQLNNAGFGTVGTGQNQGANQQGNQQQANPLGSQIRSAMISLKLIDPTGETVTSPITFDVRVSADTNSNQLIVTGPSESMELIGLLIAQLDRLPNAESVVNIFKIVNGDATALLETLQTLFASQATQGFGGQGQGQSSLGQLPLATGSGETSLVGLQFAVDRRTNSIVAAGSRADMNVIEDVLSRLDEDQLVNRIHRVFRLQHVAADIVETAISTWVQNREQTDQTDPTLGSEFQVGKRSLTVVAELESNSLIVSATPEYYELVRNIINDIDKRRRVMVQAVLAQVTLSNTDEFGIELGVQDSILFDRGLSATNPIGFPFNQVGIGNNLGAAGLATRETFAGQALSNLSIGRQNGDVGYGGLVISAGNESINVLLRALKDRGNTRILSRPQIMTLENLRGFTQVGQDIPTAGQTTSTATGFQTTPTYLQTGIQLGVLPRVSPDGTIYMEVDVANDSLAPGAGIPIQTNSDGTVITAPIINRTLAQTTVTARSGQTIVIGGLITDANAESRRGIPILSDTPIIGPLFRFDSKSKNRSELLIILRPIVIDNDEQLAHLNQLEMDRMHWCYTDVVNIHGPLDSSPMIDSETEVIYPDANPAGGNDTTPYYTETEMPAEKPSSTNAAIQRKGNPSGGSAAPSNGVPNRLKNPPRVSEAPADGSFVAPSTEARAAAPGSSARRDMETSSPR